jgi:hypothetical protein
MIKVIIMQKHINATHLKGKDFKVIKQILGKRIVCRQDLRMCYAKYILQTVNFCYFSEIALSSVNKCK